MVFKPLTKEQYTAARQKFSHEEVMAFEIQRKADLQPDNLKGRIVDKVTEKNASAVENIKKSYQEKGAKRLPYELAAIGDTVQAVTAPISETASTLLNPVIKKAGQALDFMGKNAGAAQPLVDIYKKIGKKGIETAVKTEDKLNKKVPEVRQVAKPALDIASGAADIIGVGEIASNVVKNVVKGGITTKNLLKTTPSTETIDNAVGKITQGLDKNVTKEKSALMDIDTKGVKTYKDLNVPTTEKIPVLANQVDEVYLKDSNLYKIKDLNTIEYTKAGSKVTTNHVNQALKDLTELYTNTGDKLARKEIRDLYKRATTKGLTRNEVNELSRKYGIEFETKAYGKKGEPLTSVSAQSIENTRSGLKDTANMGLSQTEISAIKNLNKRMSNLFALKKRNEVMIEAVNKAKNQTQKRGLASELASKVTKFIDIISGRSLSGALKGILPGSASYDRLNALDLEKQLSKNLKVINDAVDTGDESIINNVIKNISNQQSINMENALLPTIRPTIEQAAQNIPQGNTIVDPQVAQQEQQKQVAITNLIKLIDLKERSGQNTAEFKKLLESIIKSNQ